MILLSCLCVLGRMSGWYYFEEPEERLDSEEAREALQSVKAHHQNLLALALMEPTRKNIGAYIEAEKKASEESLRFAETWADLQKQHDFSKRYFLLLSFKEGADEAARIAKEFAVLHHWTLKGLSLDGAKIEGLDAEADRGLGRVLPEGFYAVDPEEESAIDLGSDIVSLEQLEERIVERCEL